MRVRWMQEQDPYQVSCDLSIFKWLVRIKKMSCVFSSLIAVMAGILVLMLARLGKLVNEPDDKFDPFW